MGDVSVGENVSTFYCILLQGAFKHMTSLLWHIYETPATFHLCATCY
jgi:hypothetical protein